MNGINIPQLNELDIFHDLRVDNPKIIIHSLVKYHVVDKLSNLLTILSDSMNTIDINVF
jgi:hypothetical protein